MKFSQKYEPVWERQKAIAKAFLEPRQTSTMDRFHEIS